MFTVEMDVERARDRYCRMIRARSQLRKAILKQNPTEMAFAFGWMDDILDELAAALPPEVTDGITGNESDKP